MVVNGRIRIVNSCFEFCQISMSSICSFLHVPECYVSILLVDVVL